MPLNQDEKDELVAYLDGELDEPTAQAIEARLATDAEARAELDALKQTWGMLDYLPKSSPSPDFTNRTLEKLSLEKLGGSSIRKPPVPRRSMWPTALGWAAAVLVVAGGGYWTGPRLFPVPPPESIPDSDEPLVRHLRVLEKWRFYENIPDRDFLDGLAQPDLFGEESS